jgi:hypothetical protein
VNEAGQEEEDRRSRSVTLCERGDQGDRKVDLRVVGYTSERTIDNDGTLSDRCVCQEIRRQGSWRDLTTSRVVVYQVSYEDRAVVRLRVRDGTKRNETKDGTVSRRDQIWGGKMITVAKKRPGIQ